MNKSSSVEVKVGIVTFTAILLFIGIVLWGNSVGFGSQSVVIFKFAASAGLESGSPITVNGVRRGTVAAVYNSGDSVVVEGNITNLAGLYRNAAAQIVMLEITGGKKIEMSPGNSAAPALALQDTIRGTLQADISEVIGMAADLAADAGKMLKVADSLLSAANALINNPQIVDNITVAAEQVRQLAETGNTLLQTQYGTIERIITNLDNVVIALRDGVDKYEPRLDSMLVNIETLLAETRSVIATADETLGSVKNIAEDADELVKDIRTNDGFVHKIIYDKELSSRLGRVLESFEEFIETAKEVGVNVNLGFGHEKRKPKTTETK